MNSSNSLIYYPWGARDGAVVKALASHQCGPGSTPGVDTLCELSLLLVLSFTARGFSPGTSVFPSPQKPTLPKSNSIWNARTRLNEFTWTPRCFVGKQAIFFVQLYQSFLSFFCINSRHFWFSMFIVFIVSVRHLFGFPLKRRAYSQANLKLTRSIVEIVVTLIM